MKLSDCPKIRERVNKLIEEKKSLKEIGINICGEGLKRPYEKGLRIMKELKTEAWLKQNADWLGYEFTQIRNPSGKNQYSRRPETSGQNSEEPEVDKQNQHSVSRPEDSGLDSEECMIDEKAEFKQTIEKFKGTAGFKKAIKHSLYYIDMDKALVEFRNKHPDTYEETIMKYIKGESDSEQTDALMKKA